jgi:hypothetical protein
MLFRWCLFGIVRQSALRMPESGALKSLILLLKVVGGTGIEPVTPTMSTFFPIRKALESKGFAGRRKVVFGRIFPFRSWSVVHANQGALRRMHRRGDGAVAVRIARPHCQANSAFHHAM